MSPEPDYLTGASQASTEVVPEEGTAADGASADGAAADGTTADGAAAVGTTADGAAAEGGATDSEADEAPTSTICVVCQRPIGSVADRRWKGEPVHLDCGAELRCGVSVGPSFDR